MMPRGSGGLVACMLMAVSGRASAAPVDVVLPVEASPHRPVVLEWNPLPLFVAKASADIVIAPVDHHALVLAPFYVWPTTAPLLVNQTDANGNPLVVSIPAQAFTGFGAEIGYRYYAGRGGPRGFFVGPSLIVASMTATAGDGSKTSYTDYGAAVDLGYGALVADRIALTLGLGAQYTRPSHSIPPQQFPAAIYANEGVFPRLLVGVGYGF